jgi:hypothetical protein
MGFGTRDNGFGVPPARPFNGGGNNHWNNLVTPQARKPISSEYNEDRLHVSVEG